MTHRVGDFEVMLLHVQDYFRVTHRVGDFEVGNQVWVIAIRVTHRVGDFEGFDSTLYSIAQLNAE